MAKRKVQNLSHVSIEAPNPIGMDRSRFIAEVSRAAREEAATLWDLANPGHSIQKGGRPTEYKCVAAACDGLKERHLGKWTKGRLIDEVGELLSSQGRALHPKTLEKHVDEWIGKLPLRHPNEIIDEWIEKPPLPEFGELFDEKSGVAKKMDGRRRALREEAYILKTVIGPWMKKNGLRLMGEFQAAEAKGLPPALLRKIELAQKRFRALK